MTVITRWLEIYPALDAYRPSIWIAWPGSRWLTIWFGWQWPSVLILGGRDLK